MKINRTDIYNKYDGHCAYCGCEIDIKNMQVDHIISKLRTHYYKLDINNKENLNPSCKECNHYKRATPLEDFRNWLLGKLHLRLKKLPKNPKSFKSIRRKNYLLVIAKKYNIESDKPFDKIFFYEKFKNERRFIKKEREA
jgi:5-methylcytosine-specific restriction endonuclease McrA